MTTTAIVVLAFCVLGSVLMAAHMKYRDEVERQIDNITDRYSTPRERGARRRDG